MNDKEAELWADLNVIDARREKLKETLDRLRSTPYTSNPSMIPDSGVDVRPKYDTSMDDKSSQYANTASANVKSDTAENFGYSKYPKSDFSVYRGETSQETYKANSDYLNPRSIEQPNFSETLLAGSFPHSTHSLGATSTTTSVTWTSRHGAWNDRPHSNQVFNRSVYSQGNTENNLVDNDRGKTIMKPATFDGTSSWIDYKAHFEACCSINLWNPRQKSLYLAASLRRQAQTVLGNIKTGTVYTYEDLCDALEARFAPVNQTELYRAMLREKRQKATETLPELGESIRRLTHLAYPTAPRDVTEMIAKDQFIDALSDFDMRLRIQQSRPKSLNDAVRLAVEIEAFCRAERQRRHDVGFARGATMDVVDTNASSAHSSIDVNEEIMKLRQEIQQSMRDLENKISKLSASKEADKSKDTDAEHVDRFPFKCHHCGRRGHKIKDCFIKLNQEEAQKKAAKSKPGEHCETQFKNKSHDTKSNTAAIKNATVGTESGLFINGLVDMVPCNLLVDTGATLTIISDRIFENMEKAGRIPLETVAQNIVGADGTPLEVKGKGNFRIHLGEYMFECTAVVANINADGILGLEFLKSSHCVIDVSQSKMYIQGVEHELQLQGHIRLTENNEKSTARKPEYLSTICLFRLQSKDKLNKHLLACGLEDMSKRKFECEFCDQAFGKKTILTRHIKRVHGDDRVKTATKDQVQSTTKSVGEDEDWDKDPGELIFDEVEVGRTYRKRTTPRLQGVKRKAVEEEPVLSEGQGKEPEVEIGICETTSQEEPLTESHCSCC